ncbi:hypothetical protein BROUX41_001819 [Berkeleyomyces rouxiae]|uniref:uncharacterized protein n=1 Tax=Berkeleyomyces rouxiae TaxID=2035830 RepID=UPI003B76E25A
MNECPSPIPVTNIEPSVSPIDELPLSIPPIDDVPVLAAVEQAPFFIPDSTDEVIETALPLPSPRSSAHLHDPAASSTHDLPATKTKGQLTRAMHMRCGHVGRIALAKTIAETRGSLIQDPKLSDTWACDTCLEAKAVRFTSQDSRPLVHSIMDCVHIDVADAGWTSMNDCKYFVVLTDEFTKFRAAVPILKVVKRAGAIIIEKLKSWTTQTGRQPVKLMLDNGTDVNISMVKA